MFHPIEENFFYLWSIFFKTHSTVQVDETYSSGVSRLPPMRATLHNAVSVLLLATGVGCVEPTGGPHDMSLQSVDTGRRTGSGGFLGLDILLTDEDGNPLPCSQGALDLQVQVSPPGSDRFTDLPVEDLTVRCNAERSADVAIVADNSRSALDVLPQIQEGAHRLADQVLDDGGRVSLIRVETEAHVLTPLSSDDQVVHDAIDSLHVTRGWSALYDGFRMANETLGGHIRSPLDAQTYDTVDAFCDNSRTLAIVAFSDGDDNNSAGQSQSEQSLIWYPGDGIDTTYEDVLDLRVDDITTPFYAVGMGYWIEDEQLSELALRTGGRYLPVEDASQIPDALAQVGEYTDSTHQVCAALPSQECGTYDVRIFASWSEGGTTVTQQIDHTIHLPCDADPVGRTATVLMTLDTPSLHTDLAPALAQQSVAWVSPVLQPRVLVVRDDGHHGESADDPASIQGWLLDDLDNAEVSWMDEPKGGLSVDALDGFDVVWFSNPGYPMNDRMSFESLKTFSAAGGGVVLQGDDMGWSFGNAWSMAPMTRVDWVDNGVRECGVLVNNNKHETYTVTLASDHALLGELAGASFEYADDIDFTRARGEGEVVLASANLTASPCREDRPVIVGWEPPRR